ncbi:MAG: DEAD/DEAH box helicase [Acidobacteriota bacterium]|nr:DEAD/DEAH box helicase [Acidobacteriota bacterium]
MTAGLIRSTPPLRNLDRETLPDRFTEAFARIVALRVRLRDGESPPEELSTTRTFAQRLARTNEALVAVSPDREDRRSAAFVAATAHQLVYQIDSLSGIAANPARLTADAITSDVSAMLLFLVAQSAADATEIAHRIQIPSAPSIESELLWTLVELARGHVAQTNERSLSPIEEAVDAADPAAPTAALYYQILLAARVLASYLAGRPDGEDDASAILRHVQELAFHPGDAFSRPAFGNGRSKSAPGPALFPGPFHLATLLLAVSDRLAAAAVVNVLPPPEIEPHRWHLVLQKIAEQRPYLWPNLQEAIANRYLNPGLSSVVSFPTGAGKTGVSHLKIAATLLAGRRVVFVAPTHALVDQTVTDLRAAFPGRRTRSVREYEFSFSTDTDTPADIEVMTPEACLQLSHVRPLALEGVGLMVFDECHLIHPRESTDRRSLDAMLCILRVVRLAPEADLLLLSAMIKNADEMAAWLKELTGRETLHLSMPWKPTRQLRGCVVYPQQRLKKLNSFLQTEKQKSTTQSVPAAVKRRLTAQPHGFFSVRQTWASQRRDAYAYLPICTQRPELSANASWRLIPNAGVVASVLAAPAARAGIKTLVFSQSIPVAAKIAERTSKALGPSGIELTPQESRLVGVAIDELGGSDQLYLQVEDNKVISRAATHHGLLLPEERRLIESMYARPDGLAVLSATGTLGQGMNLPSEFVIIAQDSRFDEQTGALEVLDSRELLNAAGRAGRAGKNATGMVLVIPGRVVPFDETDSRIGERWMRLREVFGQIDQCLAIDDPLTAVLDRIHAEARSPDELDRYVISRLCVSADDESPETQLGRALQGTFAAFKKRREGKDAWIESRTRSALAALGHIDPDDEIAASVRELSSSVGFPEETVSVLRADILESGPASSTPVMDWCEWLFDWLLRWPEHALRVLRPEDLERQFGSRFSRLATDGDRVGYAVPKLRNALGLWMKGEPLNVVQSVLGDTPRDLKRSTGARKFVVNILPTLAHLHFAASRIAASQSSDGLTAPAEAPTLTYIGQCVRLGFSSLEMYVLYTLVRNRVSSRRRVHREFSKLEASLPTPVGPETWAEVNARVAAARESANS